MDFNVSPGSERSRDSGDGVVEVDSPDDTSPGQATGGSSSEGDVLDRGEAIGEEEDGSDDGTMEGYTDACPGPSRKHRQVRGREGQDDPHRKRDHTHGRRDPTHRRRDTPP